jgi:hypothetical protein
MRQSLAAALKTRLGGQLVRSPQATRIIVIGGVAAGKTTARSIITKVLASLEIMPAILGIEEAHRQLCPPPARPGLYHFDKQGALILERRETQIPQALSLLTEQCQKSMYRFVLELAVKDVTQVLMDRFSEVLPEAIIVHVSAPLSVRLARNSSRGSLRMPMELFDLIPDSLSLADRERLRRAGASLIDVSNDASESDFAARLNHLVLSAFRDR